MVIGCTIKLCPGQFAVSLPQFRWPVVVAVEMISNGKSAAEGNDN